MSSQDAAIIIALRFVDQAVAPHNQAMAMIMRTTASAEKHTRELAGAAKLVVSAFAGFQVGQLIKDSAMLAARYETLDVVMENVGRNAGYTAAEMDLFDRGLQKNGIAMIESREVLSRMAQAHIDLSKSTELSRIAQDAAVIGNINSSEAFERMIHGIQSGQIDVLQTIGINVNFENSYKKLAAQLGKSTTALTENEKMQARVNVVMEAGGTIAGTYEAAMGTAGKQILSMTRYWDNLKVTAGGAFLEGLAEGTKELTGALKDSEKALADNKAQMDQWSSTIKGGVATGISDIKFAFSGLKYVFDQLPDSAVGAAGVGLIGLMLFGPTGAIAAGSFTFAIDQMRQMRDVVNEIKAGNILEDELTYDNTGLLTSKKDLLDTARRRKAQRRASTASDDILSGPTQIGTVVPEGLLALESTRTLEGIASARLASEKAASATEISKSLAKQWNTTKLNLEQEINLSGLTGLEQKLVEITNKATEYHLQFDKTGGKAAIDDWAESTKAVARQADEIEKVIKAIEYKAQANEDLLSLEKELELAGMSKYQREIQGIKDTYDLLLNKSHLYTLMGRQTEEAEAQFAQAVGVNMQKDLDDLAAKGDDTAKALDKAFSGWASNMSQDFNEMLWSAEFSFQGIAESFGKMITQMMIQASIAEPMMAAYKGAGGVSGIVGSLFGSSGFSAETSFAGAQADLSYGSYFHDGGTVGASSATHAFPSSMFANAPRFHNGLAPDEFPAILQSGERVLSRKEVAQGGGANVQVNVINNASGTKATATERTDSGGTRIIDVLVEQIEGKMGARVAQGKGLAPIFESRYSLNSAFGMTR